VRKSFETLSTVLEDQPKRPKAIEARSASPARSAGGRARTCCVNTLTRRNTVVDEKTRLPIMDTVMDTVAWRVQRPQTAVFALESFIQQTRRPSCSGTCVHDKAAEQSSNADVCWYD
jgi:hypothetical protein